MPEGTALYLRRITKGRHGTPKQFAQKCADHRLGWLALGGLWQEGHNGKVRGRWINKPDVLLAYGEALMAKDIPVWLWGYPWMGAEQEFTDLMAAVAQQLQNRILLDPELGANPARASRGRGKDLANEHAELLVRLLAETGVLEELYLSTFGNGWRIGWFPLFAFTRALVRYFGGRAGIGGQTYTDDGVIDRSIADMQLVIDKAGGTIIRPGETTGVKGIEVVPNFGTYSWDTPDGRRTKGAKARAKTPAELRLHLHEFINEDEPVDALIGWAENFMNDALWRVLAEFADLMARGACRLPRRSR